VLALIAVAVWQFAEQSRGGNITSNPEDGRVSLAAPERAPKSYFNWQQAPDSLLTDASSDTSDPDGLSYIEDNVLGALVGSYVALNDAGTYTSSAGQEVAEFIASDLRANVSYEIYSPEDFQIDADDSLGRMLSYRNDLRIALEPLLQNTTYELEVFAYYVDTNDEAYLTELARMAGNYRSATDNALKVVVPANAVAYHVGILNALSEFEVILARLTENADDPYAAAALLRTFNSAEMNMLSSFNALAGYFRENIQS